MAGILHYHVAMFEPGFPIKGFPVNLQKATLKEEETIAFTISYRPANEEKWYSLYTNQSIKMKRNKKNIVKIVKIDEHIGDATISFGEEAEMEESEQEIGK